MRPRALTTGWRVHLRQTKLLTRHVIFRVALTIVVGTNLGVSVKECVALYFTRLTLVLAVLLAVRTTIHWTWQNFGWARFDLTPVCQVSFAFIPTNNPCALSPSELNCKRESCFCFARMDQKQRLQANNIITDLLVYNLA